MTGDPQGFAARSDRRLMMELARRGLELLVSELGLELFRQPALEMLFDLYGKPEGQTRYLTALCGVSSTSERNSQRIVHKMERQTLVKTAPDLDDGRRTTVEITYSGRASIERFLDEWATSPEMRAIVDDNLKFSGSHWRSSPEVRGEDLNSSQNGSRLAMQRGIDRRGTGCR